MIADQLLRHKSNGIFNKLFNNEFLKFLETHKHWRKTLVASLLIYVVAIVCLFCLLYSRTNIKYRIECTFESSKENNATNDFFFKTNANSEPQSEPQDWFVSIIRLIMLAVLILPLVINCIQHYTNKNILGFNIIHESILNNKGAMIAVTTLIGLHVICFL
jgi:hypothetical protein